MANRGANAATLDQVYNVEGTGSDSGFPKKDTRFSKIDKYNIDLYCDDREGKIIEHFNFQYFNNRASFVGNPVERY